MSAPGTPAATFDPSKPYQVWTPGVGLTSPGAAPAAAPAAPAAPAGPPIPRYDPANPQTRNTPTQPAPAPAAQPDVLTGSSIKPGEAAAAPAVDPTHTPGRLAAKRFADKVMSANDSAFQMKMLRDATGGVSEHLNALGFGAMTALTNGIDELRGITPQFDSVDAYHAAMAAEEDKITQWTKDHPGQAWAAWGLSNLMIPGAGKAAEGIRAAEGYLPRAWKAAKAGGLYGGASGFIQGDHDWVDRFSNGLFGIPFGALAGVGIHAGAETTGAVAGLAKNLTGRAASALQVQQRASAIADRFGDLMRNALKVVSGKTPQQMMAEHTPEQVRNYEEEAFQLVRNLMQTTRYDPTKLTQHPAHQMGKDITVAEAWGRTGINQLSMLARRAGETPDRIETQLRERSANTAQRLTDSFGKAANIDPAAIEGQHSELIDRMEEANKPLYDKAFKDKPPDLVRNRDMRELLTRPDMIQAVREAQRLAAGRKGGAKDAAELQRLLDDVEANPQKYKARKLERDAKGRAPIVEPSVRAWHSIKRAYAEVLEPYRHPITRRLDASRERVRNALGTLNDLRTGLNKASDAYRKASNAGGEKISLEEKWHDAPMKMFSTKRGSTTPRQHAEYFNGLSDAEKHAHTGSWINHIRNLLQTNQIQPVMKLIKNANFQEKVRLELGPQNAERLLAEMQQEADMVANAQRIAPGGGSITSVIKEAGKDYDEAQGGIGEDIGKATERAITGAATGGIGGAVRHAGIGFVKDRWRDIAAQAQAPGSEALRNEVGKILGSTDLPGMQARLLAQPAPRVAPAPAPAAPGRTQQALQQLGQRFPQARQVLQQIGKRFDIADPAGREAAARAVAGLSAPPAFKMQLLAALGIPAAGMAVGRAKASQPDTRAPQQLTPDQMQIEQGR